MTRIGLVAAATFFTVNGAWAQDQCVVPSLAGNPLWGTMSTEPIILDISGVANDEGKKAVATEGLKLWAESECSTLPSVSTWDGSGERPAGEHWKVRVGTHADLEQLPNKDSCGVTNGSERTVYVFQGRLDSSCYISNETFGTLAERDRQSQVQTAGHEFGHVFRLGDTKTGSSGFRVECE